ncbi:MAG: carbohydrate-binding family 6 protein [Planctomycetes bacterium]|nr:carbohydrate-binding family 6 protein [Planctomycetota bacterium]
MKGYRMMKKWTKLLLCCVMVLGIDTFCFGNQANTRQVVIYSDSSEGPIGFAVRQVSEALIEKGYNVADRPLDEFSRGSEQARIILTVRAKQRIETRLEERGRKPIGTLEPQGYAVRMIRNSTCLVVGADEVGAMYGGLEVAELIRIGELKNIRDVVRKPSIPKRGIKFNIPLDARTPSYDDTGDAAQKNYVEMWNFEFWQKFLDNLALHRYNTLTLWNPHPFPSIVKLPDYPDAALEDVCITTLKPTYVSNAWKDPQFVSPEVLKNLEVVKKMSMGDKIEFWRRVMKYAKDRGIDIYFITWNVLMNSAEGKYGITTAQDNPKTIAYLRQCVRETILTYPLLAGIGVTAGENMKNRNDEYDREKWLWNTYGLGIMDAKKRQPNRQVRFIHRVWNTGLGKIMNDFAANYPDPFEISFKYAKAHMYSSTKPPFSRSLLKEMEQYDVKCWWNLRNDDIFNFRWGDPEYVRAFLSSLPQKTAGYHMGSDGYVWAREFTSLEPETPRSLEIEKHWYKFMLWGRLGYDLDMKRESIEKILLWRFPETNGLALYDTWATASKIIPLVNRFHWRDWDFMWAVEGCIDQRKGFHTVRDFITNETMQDSGMMSIQEYVDKHLANEQMQAVTPIQVAGQLQSYSDKSLKQVELIRRRTTQINRELRLTLGDIEAMLHLGGYYASKILGATDLHLFEKSKDRQNRKAAIRHLLEAQRHWEDYASVAAKLYKPQLLARTRMLDWVKILDEVKSDVKIARQSRPEN